jgi:hypothetical protein
MVDISGCAFQKAENRAHTTYFLGRTTFMSSISALEFWVLFDAFCNECWKSKDRGSGLELTGKFMCSRLTLMG